MPRNSLVSMFAAVACAAGAAIAQGPAQAQPLVPLPATPSPDCDWTVWATDSDIAFSGHTAHVMWGSHDASAAFDGSDYRAPLSGPIIVKGTNELDFTIKMRDTIQHNEDMPGFTNTYSGSIDPGGTASGTWHNDQGGSGTWTMTNTFKCIANKPAAAPPPAGQAPPPPVDAPPPAEKPPTDRVVMIIAKPSPLSPDVNVSVTSTSPIPGHCTYDATEVNGFGLPVHQEFEIAKLGKKILALLAPLPGQTYHVVLSCRGDFNGQDVEFGHQEQNFP